MKKITKTIFTAAAITAGAAAAASLSAYLTAEQFMKIALDRDAPKIMKKTGKRISGAVKDPLQESFREQLRSASEHLAQQKNETVEITGYDGETLVGHFIPCENAKRIIIAMHGWRSSWHHDFGMISDFWRNSGSSVLYAEQRGQNNSGGDYMGFGLTERYDCLEWIRWVNERFGENLPIYLGGVSMGATTVLMAAGLNLPENVHGIVADCGFTSPDAICRHIANENLHMTYKYPYTIYPRGSRSFCTGRNDL